MQEFKATQYRMICSKCKSDGAEGATVYGIGGAADSVILHDISSDQEAVEHLIALLQEHDVSLDQLLYVVEDYIAAL